MRAARILADHTIQVSKSSTLNPVLQAALLMMPLQHTTVRDVSFISQISTVPFDLKQWRVLINLGPDSDGVVIVYVDRGVVAIKYCVCVCVCVELQRNSIRYRRDLSSYVCCVAFVAPA
jgi:hypothetical protein